MEISAVAIRVDKPNEFTVVVSEVEAVFPKGGSIQSGTLMREGLFILVPNVMEDSQEMIGFCGSRWTLISNSPA